MPDRVQDLTNHRKVAQASKNYTDQKAEEILWQLAENDISTSDDNTTASTKTVPTNATRCKIKRIYGYTQKFNPSVASDSTSAMVKTMPSTVYDFDVSKVEGKSEVSENLLMPVSSQTTSSSNGVTFVRNIDGSLVLNGTSEANQYTCYVQYYMDTSLFPNGIKAGDDIYFKLFGETTGCVAMIYTYKSGWTQRLDNTSKGTIQIPSDATGLIVRVGCYNNRTFTNQVVYPMLVSGSTEPTEFKVGFDSIHNFAWTGVKVYDSDNVEQVSKTIDLSSILYNGSPLFEGNSLKAVGTAKDYITPYKAHKEVNQYTVNASASIFSWGGYWYLETTNFNDNKKSSAILTSLEDSIYFNSVFEGNGNLKTTLDTTTYTNASQVKQVLLGKTIQYQVNTPIEVNIDWSATLRHITGYSNGTITLLNTNNQDTDNTITYNSIIKENCCAKIVQSRGGNVVKTINLPTQASDGYSAGSVNNYRDLTTSKRIGNVSKESDMGLYTWNSASSNRFNSSDIRDIVKKPTADSSLANILSFRFTTSGKSGIEQTPNQIAVDTGGSLWISTDGSYTTTTLKTSMTNESLYYELKDDSKTETSIDSVDNVIEVEPSDVLSFYDENDNLVTVPSDLTYRIEVAR